MLTIVISCSRAQSSINRNPRRREMMLRMMAKLKARATQIPYNGQISVSLIDPLPHWFSCLNLVRNRLLRTPRQAVGNLRVLGLGRIPKELAHSGTAPSRLNAPEFPLKGLLEPGHCLLRRTPLLRDAPRWALNLEPGCSRRVHRNSLVGRPGRISHQRFSSMRPIRLPSGSRTNPVHSSWSGILAASCGARSFLAPRSTIAACVAVMSVTVK